MLRCVHIAHLGLALVSTVLATTPAVAQRHRVALLSPSAANSMGLERAWFTRVSVDSGRGSIAGLHQHIGSRRYTVFEVTYEGGRTQFSERDLDRAGHVLGKEGAERLARRKADELQRQQLSPQVVSHVVPEISLYVTTDQGLVQAVDGETGRIRWTTAVGNPLYPSETPGANDKYVAVVNGVDTYVLDATDGKLVWQRRNRGVPSAGPALSDRLVFIPMFNGAIEAYQLEDHLRTPWVFRSHHRTTVQPVSTPTIVAWTTDGGDLYVAEAERTNVLFRLETNAPITGAPAVLPPDRLLVGSTDGYVYCVHHTTGAIQWLVSLGEPIAESPVAIGDAIYVVTEQEGLFRLAAATGEEQWRAAGVTGFLAASDRRLYCVGRTGRLLAFSAETGASMGSLPTQTLDLRLLNPQTDRIFIGTQSGFIHCLREADRPWPLLHVSLPEQAPAERPPHETQQQQQPTQTVEPPVADPFADAAGPTSSGDPNPPAATGDRDPFAIDPPR